MAPPVIANLDFYNLHASVTNLERALGDASRQKTVRKGARTSAAHQPIEELRHNVEEDLGKVLNSPLRPARGSVFGPLPLEAVQPMRRLHEMLLRAVGPNGNPDILNDPDTAADLHHRVEAFVASVDPDHPFLKLGLDFGGSQSNDGDNEKDQQAAEGEQKDTPKAKGKGKKVAEDEQQQTPKAKGKGKKVVGTPQAPTAPPVDDGIRRSARIQARQVQVLADRQDPGDLGDLQPGEGEEVVDTRSDAGDDDYNGPLDSADEDEAWERDLGGVQTNKGKGKGAGPSRRGGADDGTEEYNNWMENLFE